MVTEESGHPGAVQRDRAQGPSPHKRQAEEQGLLGGQRRNCQEGEGKPRAPGPRAKGTAQHTKVGGAGSDSEEAREAGTLGSGTDNQVSRGEEWMDGR